MSTEDTDSVIASVSSERTATRSGTAPTAPSTASRTPVSRQASADTSDLDVFQSYQRFRLKVVSMFGSMASGLYELGADPETGRISQEDFLKVCTEKLEMMSEREALSLFQHFTNADPFSEEEPVATFKDLNIDEEEWKYVVASKKQVKTNNSTAIPFSSAPSGSSAGLYHRQINVNQVSEQRIAAQSEEVPGSPGSGSGTNGWPALGTTASSGFGPRISPRVTGMSARSSKRTPPWRQPQKPWAPSMMAGKGLTSIEAKTVLVFRPRGGDISTKGRSSLDGPWVKDRFLHHRKGEWRTEAWRCPTSREEMQPAVCAKQVLEWWPYLSPRPSPKVKLRRPLPGAKLSLAR